LLLPGTRVGEDTEMAADKLSQDSSSVFISQSDIISRGEGHWQKS
jgi:hypothetical protein